MRVQERVAEDKAASFSALSDRPSGSVRADSRRFLQHGPSGANKTPAPRSFTLLETVCGSLQDRYCFSAALSDELASVHGP